MYSIGQSFEGRDINVIEITKPVTPDLVEKNKTSNATAPPKAQQLQLNDADEALAEVEA